MWQAVKVLVIDDRAERRHDLKVILDFLGEPALTTPYHDWSKTVAAQGEKPENFAAVMLVDCRLPLRQRLQQVWEWNRHCPVILAGDSAELDPRWDSYLKHQVIGRLALPPSYATLLDVLHRADRFRELSSLQSGQGGGRPVHLFRSLVGSSRKIQDLRKTMAQLADRDMTVLICGELGTGKEVVARNLHYRSPRRNGPFVPVDCRAIPAELLEVELFGHAEGAFPGALKARRGRVDMAHQGTLFLDGIGALAPPVQIKLLRLLRESTYEMVGSTQGRRADLRIIAATHGDLEALASAGQFHDELLYSLNAFTLEVPPLRERAEDIPLLINELVSRLEGENRGSVRFNSAAILSLCRHYWSGNVRELANLVERMAITHPYGVVGVSNLPSKYRHLEAGDDVGTASRTVEQAGGPTLAAMTDQVLLPESGIDLKEYLNLLERNLIQQALADTGGVVARAAEHLTIRRTTLVEKMRKHGLQK